MFHQPVFKKKISAGLNSLSQKDISEKLDIWWSIPQKGTGIGHLGARGDQTMRITIFQENYWSFYPSELIYFAYFNMRHPVKVSHSFVDFVVNYELSNFMNYSKNNTRFIIWDTFVLDTDIKIRCMYTKIKINWTYRGASL